MIAGVLNLTWRDMKSAGVTDAYSIHRVVYDLFADVRNADQKNASVPSGILFADKGGDGVSRQILFLSDRRPKEPRFGNVQVKEIPDQFLNHDVYRFETIVNPTKRDSKTGKLVPLRTREDIAAWFTQKSEKTWGFATDQSGLEVHSIKVVRFEKKGDKVTIGQARMTGTLRVKDRALFIKSFKQGIGRGRSFGCGLLQIVPVQI